MTQVKPRCLIQIKDSCVGSAGPLSALENSAGSTIGLRASRVRKTAVPFHHLPNRSGDAPMRQPIIAAVALAFAAWGGVAHAATGDEVIAAQKCNKCHTAKTTKKGPAFADVAAKYKGNATASATLFKGLKAGGKMGDEDDHKKLEVSDDEIRAVVAVVLAAK
jgi:cytochrome c